MLERINTFVQKYLHLLLILGGLFVVLIVYTNNQPSKAAYLMRFQAAFSQQERQLNKDAKLIFNDWQHLNKSYFATKYSSNKNYFIHVYCADSLIYWNTNELPIGAFADPHFPVNGLISLQNGWYYTKVIEKGEYKVAVTFGIQKTYPYENEQLSNYFFPSFPQQSADIRIDAKDEHMIRNENEEPIFRLELASDQDSNNTALIAIFVLLLVVSVIIWHWLLLKATQTYQQIALIGVLLIVRIIAYSVDWLLPFQSTPLGDAQILALNEAIPNLGEFLVWVVILLLIYFTVLKIHVSNHTARWMSWLMVSVFVCMVVVFPKMAHSIVENSSIPLQLNEVFLLTKFSYLMLFLFGVGGLLAALTVMRMAKIWLRANWSKTRQIVVFIASILVAFVVSSVAQFNNVNGTAWAIAFCSIPMYVVVFKKGVWNFTWALMAVLLFSTASATILEQEALQKEHAQRELFANELADDRDIGAEVEFVQAEKNLLKETYLRRLTDVQNRPNFVELKEALERRVFNGFWERYDVDFYYFGTDTMVKVMNGLRQYDLDVLLQKHGVMSDIDSSLFYISDYTSQFNYVFRESLTIDSLEVCLYGTLKTKRIPEEIGFPRLLISDQTNVFQSLEGYSIAKYYRNQLVTNYGDYSYPVSFNRFSRNKKAQKMWLDKNGYNHFLFQRTDEDAIVLSYPNSSLIDWVTTIAFLLVSYGCCLAFLWWLNSRKTMSPFHHLTMAVKIQLVMVALVLVSLLGFSIGSGTFVKNQYSDYTTDLIREKIRSVNREASLSASMLVGHGLMNKRDELTYQLRKWAQVFVTDLNIYGPSGMLQGSSRPKIYNIGLVSEQMHPDAVTAMIEQKNSEFIHEEQIGSLHYLSAYVPLCNEDGSLLGYLNLQHFDQQNVFEHQVQRFFMAIINVFMLLLVLSIIGAIAVSSWITAPLRMIRRSVSRMELGKNNQRIAYTSQDEIGDLVAEYNTKLNELELAAQQLAQTERETAWREMAKQVAHEIKNPLTPMKLSIQHLQRVFDPSDPRAAEKVQRVSESVIEQIDALTSIANAFSNFAKLPHPVMTEVDVCELAKVVAALFESDEKVVIDLNGCTGHPVFINADREMMLRVFNNLVSNGIQAVAFNQVARLQLSITQLNSEVFVRISDNGTGISSDQVHTIFEPYFTTKSTGTGLGLAMVKQIIETHQGTIEIESTSTQGTTVLVKLPLAN